MLCYEIQHTYKGRPCTDRYWRNTEQGDALKTIWESAASTIMQYNGHGIYLHRYIKASSLASSIWAC